MDGPGRRFAIDGQTVPFTQTDDWPENGLMFRVFWFTVESTNLGGALTEENAATAYGTGLSWPRRWVESSRPNAYRTATTMTTSGHKSGETDHSGTIRLYARVEIVERRRTSGPSTP